MATCDRTILIINNSSNGKSIDSRVDGSTDLYPHLLGRDGSLSYRVITEHYSGPVLDVCRTHAIDGIVLESHAPDFCGFDLLTHLKTQLGNRCPPIIMIDANDVNLARRAFQAGAADYLSREQVTAETLHQALDTALTLSEKAVPDPTIALSLGDRYRDLIGSIDEGFCICKMVLNENGAPVDYRFLETNSAFETLTGIQQPVGKTARELLPGLETVWFETYGRVALDREPIRFEQESVFMQRWFDVYAFPMGEPQHHLFGLLFKNVTARKAMEQEREQFLALGSDLQVIAGRDGYVQWVSPTFEHVLGWSAAEITARPWTEFVHPDDIDSSLLEVDSLFSGNKTFAFENRYRHKDGSYRSLLWRAQASSTQQIIYGAGIDITESKRRAANTEFLANIATEFSRLSSANETMQTIGAKIGQYLNLSICAFAEIDDAEEEAVIHYSWHDDDIPDVLGAYHISDFVSDDFRQAVHNRETVVIQDTSTDPRTDGEKYAALNIHSFVSVPFYKDGQWRFLLNVYDSVPRIWRDDEIEL
ncbi:MAG: PAS domain S-box protein, partial [Leptolyngbyaceae bacterium]|nr:PAS domain S-box protein [Leptolyngbyaceae bacterium]